MIEKLITQVFDARNAAHVAHWQTKSFAQHAALGDFYTEVVGKLDNFVEVHMGGFGRIGDVPGIEAADPVKRLREDFVWLTTNREEACKQTPALENIYDDIVSTYLKTIYKLENLE